MTAAVVRCPLAVLYAMRGDAAVATDALRAAESAMTDIGHAYAEAFLPLFAATIHLLGGRPVAAEAALHRSRAAAESLADGHLLATAWRDLARARLDQGDPEGALGWIGMALDSAPGTLPIHRAELLAMKARATADRDPAAAGALAAEAVRVAAQIDAPGSRASVLLDQAYVLIALDDRHAARRAADEAWRCFAAKGHGVGVHRADAVLSALADA